MRVSYHPQLRMQVRVMYLTVGRPLEFMPAPPVTRFIGADIMQVQPDSRTKYGYVTEEP